MHFASSALAPLTFYLVSFASQASATVFQATGTFDNGALLGGALTIDVNDGAITASSLTITGAGTFSAILFQDHSGPPIFYSVLADNTAGSEEFSFGLFADSLIGFNGGSFCAADTGACLASVYYPLSDPFNQSSLLSGNLAGATPEPSALYLCGITLMASMILRGSRCSKASLLKKLS
jgi:hypothetical protein